MKQPLFIVLSVIFLAGSAAGQQKFEPTVDSRRDAIKKGQSKEFLTAMETMALEAEAKKDWERAGWAYTEASFAASSLGQLQKALSHANKGIEMGERAKNPVLEANAIMWLGQAYAKIGQPEKEREWLKKGVETIKQIPGNREFMEGRIYRQLGQNYLLRNEIQQAIEYISYSIRAFESYSSYMQTQRVRANVPQARRFIQQAEAQIVNGLNQLGTAYLKAGNPQEAIKAFERGMAIWKTGGVKNSADGALTFGLGQAYLAQKDFPRALENLTKALQMGEGRSSISIIQQASSGIGDLFLQTQREAEAIPYYKKAIESIESTRSLLESEEFRTSFFEDKGQIYGGIILAHLGAKKVDEAFNYNERARSRAFLDILGSKVQLTTHGAVLEEERALQAKISLLKARTRAGVEEGVEAGGGQSSQELEAAQKAYNDFLAKVRKENKEQASLMNVEPLAAKEVQNLLDPGQSLIEYFVTPEKILLWVVDKERVNSLTVSISQKELASKVNTLRQAISELKPLDDYQKLSQELYRLLIQPAVAHIKGKELILIPHAVLHYLPFHALYSPQGRYLVEEYSLSYLSSASLLQFVKEKRRAKGDRVLALGNPDLGDPRMNLQFAELEAREVQRLYPQSTVLLKREATEEKGKALSPQNDIIHFASHAELSEEDPLSSAILLAKGGKEDGRLEVREIFGMDLKANLIVLSACETGLGKLSSGDELVGLTRAFIYAGTPSVMASLWKVEDSSTAALMASFYKNLKTMTKVEALRRAQLELITGKASSDLLARRGIGGVGKLGETPIPNPQSLTPASSSISTSHPYFWAPFILVGDGK